MAGWGRVRRELCVRWKSAVSTGSYASCMGKEPYELLAAWYKERVCWCCHELCQGLWRVDEDVTWSAGQGSWVCSVHADSLASDGASRRKGHARRRAGLGVSRGGLADCVVCWALPCWGARKGKTRWVDGVLGQDYAMGPVALEVGDGVSRE